MFSVLLIGCLCLCLGACGGRPPAGEDTVVLKAGESLDENGNIVATLSAENWQEYVHFEPALMAASEDANGNIISYQGLARLVLKETYAARVLSGDLSGTFRSVKRQGHLLTYTIPTQKTSAIPFAQENWVLLQTEHPHTEESNRDWFSVSLTAQELQTGYLVTACSIPLFPAHKRVAEDGLVVSMPGVVDTVFEGREITGTLVLTPA